MSDLRQVGPNEWVGPEKTGITPHLSHTEHAKRNYKAGNVLHEPLMPGNYIVPIDYENRPTEHMGEFWDAFTAGGHQTFLDMRPQSSHARGNILYSMLVAVFLWGGYKCVTAWAWGSQEWALNTVDQGILSVFVLIVLIGFFRPVALPIRLHKRNQEVYVKHKGVLYRIPWDECELSVMYKGFYLGAASIKDTYQLVMWLNPKHAVNQDLTGEKHERLLLNEEVGGHVSAYGYYEYIRRYMTGDEPFAMTISAKEKLPRKNNELMNQFGPISSIFRVCWLLVLLLLLKPSLFALKYAPIKDKWPEEVHEWTGERCNWI
ncbi:hypothetical protein [Vibrio palustris]|uniref:Uncharacterized protein n=1 Tax=Vibrio palustris TaxID=1918946 RepID=A0A1R4B2D5_9VIBR|nr:hypothetical protein [Vibrio palustris]SJL83077.1 hypothetical protein VPAL9027_01025 [Vibrio palustris]